MKRRRRLRKLVPDAELIRRRVAGEPLRELASDYDVTHTTLLRYFERPEIAREMRQAAKQLRAEQRAVADRRSAEQRLEREVRRKAKEQAAREREDDRSVRAVVAERTSRRRRPRSEFGAWLDERDERRPLTRADLHSQNDETAARVVAAGGGMQDVIDATDLRTIENVVGLIDPAIAGGQLRRLAELPLVAVRAVDNDFAEVSKPKRPSLARKRAPATLGAGWVGQAFGFGHAKPEVGLEPTTPPE